MFRKRGTEGYEINRKRYAGLIFVYNFEWYFIL